MEWYFKSNAAGAPRSDAYRRRSGAQPDRHRLQLSGEATQLPAAPHEPSRFPEAVTQPVSADRVGSVNPPHFRQCCVSSAARSLERELPETCRRRHASLHRQHTKSSLPSEPTSRSQGPQTCRNSLFYVNNDPVDAVAGTAINLFGTPATRLDQSIPIHRRRGARLTLHRKFMGQVKSI